MSTFLEINDALNSARRTTATFDDLIHGYKPEGAAIIDASSMPYYADYPPELGWLDIFPFGFVGLLLVTILYNWYDGGRMHWGTKGFVSGTILFDLAAGFAVLAMWLDTVVTVNGTWKQYGKAAGLEAEADLRQWAAVWKRTGLNFAQSMALTDVLEGAVIWTTWYYGRKRKNFVSLIYLIWLGVYHFYFGYLAWPQGEGLLDVSLFYSQLFTRGHGDRPYQGGGPQTVVGIA